MSLLPPRPMLERQALRPRARWDSGSVQAAKRCAEWLSTWPRMSTPVRRCLRELLGAVPELSNVRIESWPTWSDPARVDPGGGPGGAVAVLEDGDGPLLIQVCGTLLARAAHRALGHPFQPLDLRRPLTAYERGAAAWACARLLEALGVDAVVTDLRPDLSACRELSQAHGPFVVASMRWRLVETGRLRIIAPTSRARALECAPASPAVTALLHDLTTPATILTRPVDIRHESLAQLRPEDLVPLEGLSARPSGVAGRVELRVLGVTALASLDPGRPPAGALLRIHRIMKTHSTRAETEPDPSDSPTKMIAPIQSAPEAADAEAVDLIADLPVPVHVELGRVTLSARELLRLTPGWIVPFGVALEDDVELRVGDRVLARGELVEVDGKVGVRVREVAG